MKITVINGQNHKGSSYHIGKLVAEKIDGENEIVEFFLPRDLPHFCMGCYQCLDGDEKCPYFEEKHRIMKSVEESGILIFTTPTYCVHASAPMKAFLDLTFTYWLPHRPRNCMFEKKAFVVSTAAGSGAKSAVKDVTTALFYWGVPYVKSYAVLLQAMDWESVKDRKKQKIEKDTTRIAKALSQKTVRVGFRQRFMFNMMGMMQKNGMGSSGYEKEYWDSMGWLGSKRPWK